ncbi:MAG: metallophosphoesterase [Planctomyces sp.]|nr:metallophosphoesterase [Planctomyces sp.]
MHEPAPDAAPLPLDDPHHGRRRFLQWAKWGTAAAVLGTGGYVRWIEPHWYEIVCRDLPIAGLPAALEGRTLLQLSDIHVGEVVSERYLVRAFRAAQRLNADIVALTGDFITHSDDADFWPLVERVYAHVPRGRLATLGCLGNHDYGRGWVQPDVADAVTERLEASGVEILRPGVRDVEGLAIAGLDDLWGSQWERPLADESIPQSAPAIVLCHNPDACDMSIWGRFQGWILSGHTHGGQCRPPFGKPPLLPVTNKRYTSGEFDVGKGRRLYINRGLGYLWKIRFCVRPEMTLFTLRAAPEKA